MLNHYSLHFNMEEILPNKRCEITRKGAEASEDEVGVKDWTEGHHVIADQQVWSSKLDLSSIPTQSTEQGTCQKGQSWDTELDSQLTDNHKTPLAPRDLQQTHSIISIIMTQQHEKKNMQKILGKISFSSNTSKALGKKISSYLPSLSWTNSTMTQSYLLTC